MNASSRIVVTGAGGQVGSLLAERGAAQGRTVLALPSARCDITDPAAIARVVRPGDVVVNCAAYTDVDGAESDEAAAFAVNATGPGHLAHACAATGARLLHLSTDYVFSGDFGAAQPHPYEVSDTTGPLSVYGRSKLAGEQAVLAGAPDAVVVRTAWVYTGVVRDFVAVMRRLADGDGPVDVVDDQVGSPTFAGDLVDALLTLVDAPPAARLLHAANAGAVSRHEQARAVFAAVGADPERVRPVSSAAHPRPAARPGYSALSGAESERAGLPPLRDWHSALVQACASTRRPPG